MLISRISPCRYKLFWLSLLLICTSLPVNAQDSITFVQITDAHLFDSGKIRVAPTASQQEKEEATKNSKVEIADTRLAWNWALLEINRLARSEKLDFVAFTGDLGLEKVCGNPVLAGCFPRDVALDEVARAFNDLLVEKIFLVPGNNDLVDEDPQTLKVYTDFVSDLQKKCPKVVDLIAPSSKPEQVGIFNIVGLDSSSFKNAPPKAPRDDCWTKNSSQEWNDVRSKRSVSQDLELARIAALLPATGPVLIFTHVPNLDDPWIVANCPSAYTYASWNLSPQAEQKWQALVAYKNVLGVFAGHFHDNNTFKYRRPYAWIKNSPPPESVMKTFVAPPLAVKFQPETPQARGFMLVRATRDAVTQADIHWFGPLVGVEHLLDRPSTAHLDNCIYWIAGIIVLVLLLLLFAFAPRRFPPPGSARSTTLALSGRDSWALMFSFIYIVISVFLIWFIRKQLNVEESATLVTLLLVPLIVYGISSGRLAEFSGPGGWGAKFRQIAAAAVNPSSEEVNVTVPQDVVKGGFEDLIPIVKNLEAQSQTGAKQPILMIMAMGNAGYYNKQVLSAYLKTLSCFPNFRFVVFVDSTRKFVAYVPAWMLYRPLEINWERDASEMRHHLIREVDKLIKDVNAGNRLEYPGLIRETISPHSTNAEALQKMANLGLDAILVVDDETKKIKGVVERDKILTSVLSGLTEPANA